VTLTTQYNPAESYQTTSASGYQGNLSNNDAGHPLLEGNTDIRTMTLHCPS